jgi:predicted transcriptional regulator
MCAPNWQRPRKSGKGKTVNIHSFLFFPLIVKKIEEKEKNKNKNKNKALASRSTREDL